MLHKRVKALRIIEPFIRSTKKLIVLHPTNYSIAFLVESTYYKDRFTIKTVYRLNNFINKINYPAIKVLVKSADYLVTLNSLSIEKVLFIADKLKLPLFIVTKINPKTFYYRNIFYLKTFLPVITLYDDIIHITIRDYDKNIYSKKLNEIIELIKKRLIKKIILVKYNKKEQFLNTLLNINVEIIDKSLSLIPIDLAIQVTGLMESLFNDAYIIYVPER
ncbi:MAG: hypothetical protein DRJ52_00125 [Thermoprotei archaeon]|nr:MAG: hypothetical protein DRJ52_00125 [Thermoprotei archaeon]